MAEPRPDPADEASLQKWEQQASMQGTLADGTQTISPVEETASSLVTLAVDEAAVAAGADAAAATHIEADGRYELHDRLGSGGMGEVLLASQKALRRSVAIKVLRAGQDDPQRGRAFIAEMQVAGRLDHPAVVPVHDAGAGFYVMKRIQGQDLDALLDNDIDLEDAVDILLRVCDAVACAHDLGVIHRDIKPGNIMVGAYGEVLLVDWGLALCWDRSRCDDLPIPGNEDCDWLSGGTPAYAAPEMVRARPGTIGPAADVFLLGSTLYRICAGRPPYGRTRVGKALVDALRCRWTPLTERDPGIPALLASVAARAMDPDPRERGTVADFADGLRRWQRQAGAAAEARAMLERGRDHGRRAAESAALDEAYAEWEEATSLCDRARALDPELIEARTERRNLRESWARRALEAGDHNLARVIVAREDSDERTTPLTGVREEIDAAIRDRERSRAHLAQLRRLTPLLAVLALIIGAYALAGRRHEARDEHAMRALALHDEADHLADGGNPTAALDREIAALKALGGDGDPVLVAYCCRRIQHYLMTVGTEAAQFTD